MENGEQIDVQADSDKLREVITNLVGNSLKFTEVGGIKIKYVKRQIMSGYNLPNEVIITLSNSRYNLITKLEYEKLEVNLYTEINFVIPQKYEICN